MLNIIGSGRGVFDFDIEGEVLVINSIMNFDFNNTCAGKIIIIRHPSPDVYILLKDAIGIVAESGGITSHLAISAIEMGKPAVVGVSDIVSRVNNGMKIRVVSINGEGIIYAVE